MNPSVPFDVARLTAAQQAQLQQLLGMASTPAPALPLEPVAHEPLPASQVPPQRLPSVTLPSGLTITPYESIRNHSLAPPAPGPSTGARVPAPLFTGIDRLQAPNLASQTQKDPKYTFFTYKQASFNDYLQHNDLMYDYQLPLDTSIVTIHDMVISDMEASAFRYQCVPPTDLTPYPHENLSLRLIGVVNRGQRVDGDMHLVMGPIFENMTLQTLVTTEKARYGVASCIEQQKLVVHFAVRRYPIHALLPTESASGVARPHSCLSQQFYMRFRSDSEDPSSDDESPIMCDIEPCVSCTELAGASSSVEARSSRLPSTTGLMRSMSLSNGDDSSETRAVSSNLPNNPQSSTQRGETTTWPSARALQRTSSLPSALVPHLPTQLWSAPWASPSDYTLGIDRSTTIEELRDNIFSAATEGAGPVASLKIRGENITELVANFRARLVEAAERGDFTEILAQQRYFEIHNNGSRVSYGEGIEREVLAQAYKEFQDNTDRFLTAGLDDCYVLFQSPIAHISSSRKTDLMLYGALTALQIIFEAPPTPFDPVFLHYLLNNCDFSSVTSGILSEWHYQFHSMIRSWIDAGSSGDISEFTPWLLQYLELGVQALSGRDRATHEAIAPLLVYKAVIGSEGPNHIDTRRFLDGFLLPCRNGFNFSKAVKAFDGGSELMLSMLWTNQITSYDSVRDNILCRLLAAIPVSQRTICIQDQTLSLNTVVENFLSGTGVPCQASLDWARREGIIHPSVSIDDIDLAHYRVRKFYIAATGSSSFNAGLRVKITIVNDGCGREYAPIAADARDACIAQGRISWKTCSRQVAIPASYFTKLANYDYTSVAEEDDSDAVSARPRNLFEGRPRPRTALAAIESWLLLEILSAIGHHGFL
ncbi:hypothetical protein BV25DRAFT_1920006 [Artomyces pyxidatus]|uniref:Uncharacterized protein n=1 Tax=Artomyces pyxidatus TaxID=48021 RepID=A0ACB8SP55_9AGAM|nr:hypothetical protein BV25DRAFT_1920006 [Artomyces pyxidatus]